MRSAPAGLAQEGSSSHGISPSMFSSKQTWQKESVSFSVPSLQTLQTLSSSKSMLTNCSSFIVPCGGGQGTAGSLRSHPGRAAEGEGPQRGRERPGKVFPSEKLRPGRTDRDFPLPSPEGCPSRPVLVPRNSITSSISAAPSLHSSLPPPRTSGEDAPPPPVP